ncbi:MAG: guanylate kinase [Candidatus Moraniibacteriota bacterium]
MQNSKFLKRVLIIGGPTGSGETTVTNEIIKQFPVFTRLVTATSRKPRNGEKDKFDYYFFSKEEFEKYIANGKIIEYTYIKNRDAYYGTYKPDLDEKIAKGFNVIVNVDIVGAKYYKENYNATTIFIKPESIEELKGRLANRDKNIDPEELNKRIKNAENEIEKEMPFYDYVVVNANGKLEKAVEKTIDILKKEKYSLA